jgi:hypothetical protein
MAATRKETEADEGNPLTSILTTVDFSLYNFASCNYLYIPTYLTLANRTSQTTCSPTL